MSSLLVIAFVALAIGAVGDGFRGARSLLSSLVRSAAGGRARNRYSPVHSRSHMQLAAILCIVVGAFGALGTVLSQNEGAATFSAIMLGIGLPMLVVCIYRGLGIAQPPLYAWVLVAGIIVSPFGLIAWYAALISVEIIAAGLLLLWFDRKDRILDTYGEQNTETAQERISRLRRTMVIMIGLACVVALTAIGARFVWLWLIVAGVVAAIFMVRKIRAMKEAKAQAAAEREAEVERILNTKIPGLDDDDDELLRRYSRPGPPNQRPHATQVRQNTAVSLRKGERRVIGDSKVEVRFVGGSSVGGIDCYTFLLDDRSKVRGDDDLVFFGQPRSRDGAVQIVDGPSGTGVNIELARVPISTDRIEVVFGLGEDAAPQETWSGGTVTVQTGSDVLAYPVDADGKTRTVDALRLYRHGNDWKVWMTDHRSIHGISSLCAQYGVEVA